MNNQEDKIKTQTLKLIGIAASSIFLAGSMPIVIGLVNMRERISLIEQEQISTHDVISLFKKQVDLDAEIVKITADIHTIQEAQNKNYVWIDKLAVIEERQNVVREQLRNLEEDVRNLERKISEPSNLPGGRKTGSLTTTGDAKTAQMASIEKASRRPSLLGHVKYVDGHTTSIFKLTANDVFKSLSLMIERMKL